MKKLILLAYILALALTSFVVVPTSEADAATPDYTNSHLMDDAVFDNVGSMSEAAIQSFLVAQGPCLANYQDVDATYSASTGWTYSGSVLASHTIYKAAQMWGINPQVILATLQKEESLITGTSCDAWRYASAMGYACPDSGGCNSHYAGFTKQVLWGSWQLKFNKERSLGNTTWDGDGDITYVGYMTKGSFKRCDSCSPSTYDGNATIDGQVIYLETGATASLYTYTPHLGQSFPGIFEGWFGSVLVPSNPALIVWRLYNGKLGIHFFTISTAERDNAISKLGYQLEGGAFIGYAQPGSGLTAVYRLYAPGAKYYFYTNSLDESIVTQQRLGYQMNGIAFYVPAAASISPQTLSVYRLLDPKTGRHLWTTDLNERATLATRGWSAEGIAYFAY